MKQFNLKPLLATLFGLAFIVSHPAMATPASFTESNRRMVEACVDPQIAGQTALRKKDSEPKTHTLTFQFSSDYRTASVIAGSRVAKTADCTAVFNLLNGRITGEVSIDGVIHDYTLQFTSGLAFSVTAFPLPMVAEGEQTSLWRVSNGTNEVIVGGVVNGSLVDFWTEAFGVEGVDILRPSDFPLPAGFEEAYEQADVILTQSDPSQFNTSLLTLNGLAISPQTNVANSLDTVVYDELSEYMLDEIGINVAGLGALRPHWMADLVVLMSAFNAGYVTGVETYFQARAVADDKINWGLEEADDAMFTRNINMLNENGSALVAIALSEVKDEAFTSRLDALLDAWRTGDDDYIDDVLVEPERLGEMLDFTRFFTERYVVWMNVFDDMLESSQKEFVLMDVRYLVGVDSFLVALQDAGYTVERY